MKKQKCNHPAFYTINNRVYCNNCHEYLGYFIWEGKNRGFFKETKDTIQEKYLNEKTVKTDVS